MLASFDPFFQEFVVAVQSSAADLRRVLALAPKTDSGKQEIDECGANLTRLAGFAYQFELDSPAQFLELIGMVLQRAARERLRWNEQVVQVLSTSMATLIRVLPWSVQGSLNEQRNDPLTDCRQLLATLLASPDVTHSIPADSVIRQHADSASIELFQAFSLEVEEHAENIADWLESLRLNPQDPTPLVKLRRTAHTLKGSARTIGLNTIGKAAGSLESYLDKLSSGIRGLDLHTVQFIETIFHAIDDLVHGLATPQYVRKLHEQIELILAEPDPKPIEQQRPSFSLTERPTIEGLIVPESLSKLLLGSDYEPEVAKSTDQTNISVSLAQPQPNQIRIPAERLRTLEGLTDALMTRCAVIPDDFESWNRRLDQLLKSGELGAFRNEFQSFQSWLTEEHGQVLEMARLVATQTRSLRQVPFSTLQGRLNLTVRQLARQFGKEVKFDLLGDEIEVDRGILDQLTEPLQQLVRNAVDHGIEKPDDRVRDKKPREGKVILRIKREAEKCSLELQDDGRGIDLQEIREIAIKKGIYSAQDAAKLTGEQLKNLIFQPGVTTGNPQNGFSGRGIGLDVVKAGIDQLGGSIEFISDPVNGTTFRLQIPISTPTPIVG
jgi:two-component system, chemotaxis family, sensor kinase CheA